MRMTRRSLILATPGLLLRSAVAGAASDDLVIIVNRATEVNSLSVDELEAIFTTRRRYWSGSRKIVVFNLPPKSAERVTFDRAVLNLDASQVGQYWIDRKIRGGAPPPRSVPDAALLLNVIIHAQDSIGYVPAALVTADVRVVARVTNGRVTAADKQKWLVAGETP